MMKYDFHVHTKFCDGKNTAEEMVLTAIEKNFGVIGFSGHAYTSFDSSFCMSFDGELEYKKEVLYLKEKYADKIEIYVGCERDYFCDGERDGFDYVIGSVHYIKKDGAYLSVDLSADEMEKNIKEYYGEDVRAYLKDYYDLVAECPEKTNADIIGHFDLVTKFNEKRKLFSEDEKWYRDMVLSALDAALDSCDIIEVNTGAISRGYTKKPYPTEFIIRRVIERGKKFILSGDSHSCETLGYRFDESRDLLKSFGVKEIAVLKNGRFDLVSIDM